MHKRTHGKRKRRFIMENQFGCHGVVHAFFMDFLKNTVYIDIRKSGYRLDGTAYETVGDRR